MLRFAVVLFAMIFLSSASAIAEQAEVIRLYEHLHQQPELGKQEYRTADFIRHELHEFGYRDLQTVSAAPTTVIAVLEGGKPGPVICFRAEMDARKCDEQSGVSYASTTAGIMHNCGHDAHAAILLETAHRLIEAKNEIAGKIVFLFQPAEECAGGADDIVADGILKKLGVEAMFAQHCSPGVATGKHTLVPGPSLAGSSTISIKLSGKGGHAAQPHERDDLVGLASLMTVELQRLPSRCIDVINYPTVCAITNFQSGSDQVNVAPEKVTIAGTVRSFYGIDEKLFHGKSFRDLVTQLVSGLAGAYGAQADLVLKAGSPPTINNIALCKKATSVLESKGIKIENAERGMFAEDFSYYTSEFPCAYFGLGIANADRGNANVHSSHFTIDEACLEHGVQLFLALADNSNSIVKPK